MTKEKVDQNQVRRSGPPKEAGPNGREEAQEREEGVRLFLSMPGKMPAPALNLRSIHHLQRTIGNRQLSDYLAPLSRPRQAQVDIRSIFRQAEPDNTSEPGESSEAGIGYQEKKRTHIQIRIVGHASPRWQGAKSRRKKAALNKKLSEERAHRVRQMTEAMFRRQFGDQTLTFSYDIDYASPREAEGDVNLGSESRGSEETLREAEGSLEANEPHMRRVEIFVRLTQMTDGEAPSSHPKKIRLSNATRRWAIKVGMGGSASIGPASGAFAIFKLKNRYTGEEVDGELVTGGMGAGVKWKPVGASVSWGDYTNFLTDEQVNFSDFDGRGVRLTSLGVGILIIGYERTYLTIYGMGSDAASMHVGGWSTGVLGGGGFVNHGNMILNKIPSSTHEEDIVVTEWDPYQFDTGQDFGHVIWFDTGISEPSGEEEAMLRQFVYDVSQQYVKTGE